jgi:hypothetical protein
MSKERKSKEHPFNISNKENKTLSKSIASKLISSSIGF